MVEKSDQIPFWRNSWMTEGSGRTARVHVSEESHSGIVPMNHSNKDGTLVGGE
jgi:hypothetical protein